MPLGAPLYVVPKSGCKLRSPHDAMSVAELASTGELVMSVFHALSAGNGRRPFSDATAAVSTVAGAIDEPHAAAERNTNASPGKQRDTKAGPPLRFAKD